MSRNPALVLSAVVDDADETPEKRRVLRIAWTQWEHAAAFLTAKVTADDRLVVRVPFSVAPRVKVQLELTLPNALVFSVDAVVTRVAPASEVGKTPIELKLLWPRELRDRMRNMVLGQSPAAPAVVVPAASPADVPIDEPLPLPASASAPTGELRAVYEALRAKLDQLREASTFDVLGVTPGDDIAAIRGGYFRCVREHHPDRFARYENAAIARAAQEVFIYINRAYDRLRDVAVAEGGAVIAGPALLDHSGAWIINDDDVEAAHERNERSVVEIVAPKLVDEGQESGADYDSVEWTEPGDEEDAVAPTQWFEDLDLSSEPTGEQSLLEDDETAETHANELWERGKGDPAAVKDALASLLRKVPRNRKIRALYHVAQGAVALQALDHTRAAALFEVALAHDGECAAAREALALMQEQSSERKGLWSRWFR